LKKLSLAGCGVLLILALAARTGWAGPDTLRTTPPATVASAVMEEAKLALWKSLVQPGWGQWHNGRPFKAALFVGAEIGLIWGIVTQHNRWQQWGDRARQTDDPALQYDYQRRSNFYLNDRNKLLWWLLWFELFNITDAYVDAALVDFDDTPDLSLQLLPGGAVVCLSLPLPLRRGNRP